MLAQLLDSQHVVPGREASVARQLKWLNWLGPSRHRGCILCWLYIQYSIIADHSAELSDMTQYPIGKKKGGDHFLHGSTPVGTGRCGAYLGDALANVWISDLPAADGGLDTSWPESRAAMLFLAAFFSILLRISGIREREKESSLILIPRASQLHGKRECNGDQTRDV